MNQPPYGYDPAQRRYMPVPQHHAMAPQPYGYAPVQTTVVKERGFNPITLLIHLFAWMFLHWWLVALTFGLWLLVAIPVTFIGWKVKRTVPVQHDHLPPHPGW
jgi:hypothetical protein